MLFSLPRVRLDRLLDVCPDLSISSGNYFRLILYEVVLWIGCVRASGDFDLSGSMTLSTFIANIITLVGRPLLDHHELAKLTIHTIFMRHIPLLALKARIVASFHTTNRYLRSRSSYSRCLSAQLDLELITARDSLELLQTVEVEAVTSITVFELGQATAEPLECWSHHR